MHFRKASVFFYFEWVGSVSVHRFETWENCICFIYILGCHWYVLLEVIYFIMYIESDQRFINSTLKCEWKNVDKSIEIENQSTKIIEPRENFGINDNIYLHDCNPIAICRRKSLSEMKEISSSTSIFLTRSCSKLTNFVTTLTVSVF